MMQSALSIEPFRFDRTFSAPELQRTPQHRRAGDARELAMEIESLRREMEMIHELHQHELETTRREAFDAGLEHARNERESAVLASVDALQASLEIVSEQFVNLRREVTAQAAELAMAAAETIAGHAIGLAPDRAIDEAIGRALAQVARGEEIDVHVHPDLVDDIEQRVANRQRGDRRRLNICVTPDDAIAPGDALLRWDRGGVALSAADRRRLVSEEIGPLLAAQEG